MAKQDNNRGLTDRQIKAIPFLVSAPTSEKGCKAAHVSRNTYYEWLKNPVFKEELNRCRDAIISESFGILKQNVTAAVDTLVNLLSGPAMKKWTLS
ncbi:MAG: phBC6A51 family helix-turn-helix protein [Syntrophales bacterium]|jgi:hypothetical protein|nr:phBC6A51 family helix-turn-helix protein [Syntrophales bacterium]